MGRLRAEDRRWVREASARLQTYDPGDGPALRWLVPLLHAISGTRGTAGYSIERRAGGFELGPSWFCHEEMAAARMRAVLDRWLREHNKPWGLFDFSRPPAAQRDRLVATPSLSGLLRGEGAPPGIDLRTVRDGFAYAVETLFRPIRWDHPQARVLVCDGPRLLAWFGFVGFREFDHRQLALLRALAAPLKRRLLLEETLERATVAGCALEAVLALLPRAAFVISSCGRILYANAPAQVALQRDRSLATELSARNGPDPRRFEVTALPTAAVRHHLVILRSPPAALDTHIDVAARRWALTPRETEIVRQLARGASNRRIAAELECAEGTVQIHVSRVLAKAEVESRAELLARLLAS